MFQFQIAKENDSRYFETSAKTDINVEQAFTDLVQSILYKVRVKSLLTFLFTLPCFKHYSS